MEFTIIDVVITVIILSLCGLLIVFRRLEKANYSGPDECFVCNKTDCKGCPIWDPMVFGVESAYVQKSVEGKVVATATLTFKDDFVIAQSPAGGDQVWQIPNLVGQYKAGVVKWADGGSREELRSVNFS